MSLLKVIIRSACVLALSGLSAPLYAQQDFGRIPSLVYAASAAMATAAPRPERDSAASEAGIATGAASLAVLLLVRTSRRKKPKNR